MCLKYIRDNCLDPAISGKEQTVYKLGNVIGPYVQAKYRGGNYEMGHWHDAHHVMIHGDYDMVYRSGFHVYPNLRDAILAKYVNDIIECRAKNLMYHGVELQSIGGAPYGSLPLEVKVFQAINYIRVVTREEIEKCMMENLF